jgi:hypothetical protein
LANLSDETQGMNDGASFVNLAINPQEVLADIGPFFIFGGANQSQNSNINYPFVLEFKNISSINYVIHNNINLFRTRRNFFGNNSNFFGYNSKFRLLDLNQFVCVAGFDKGTSSNISLPFTLLYAINQEIRQGQSALLNISTVQTGNQKYTVIATVCDLQGNLLGTQFIQTISGNNLNNIYFYYFIPDSSNSQGKLNLIAGQDLKNVWICFRSAPPSQSGPAIVVPSNASSAMSAINTAVQKATPKAAPKPKPKVASQPVPVVTTTASTTTKQPGAKLGKKSTGLSCEQKNAQLQQENQQLKEEVQKLLAQQKVK